MIARTTIRGYIENDKKAHALALSKDIKISKGGPEFAKLQAAHVASEEKVLPAKLKEPGAKNVEATMAAYKKSLAKWEKLSAEIGTDEAKLAAALKTHICDKIDPDKL